MSQKTSMRVECEECRFARIIRPEDDELPGEVVIRHGKETGHRLDVSAFGERRDSLAP